MARLAEKMGTRLGTGARRIAQTVSAPAGILMDDFSEGVFRTFPASGADLWLPQGAGQATTVEMFEGSYRMKLTSTAIPDAGANNRARCQFYPNTGIGGYRYPYPNGFLHTNLKDCPASGQEAPGWTSTFNRLEFWMHSNKNITFNGRDNIDLGVYVKPFISGGNDDTQGSHWYNMTGATGYAGEWVKYSISWSPPANNYGCQYYAPNPTKDPACPCCVTNPYEDYWNGMTRMYINLQTGVSAATPADPIILHFDDFYFYEDLWKQPNRGNQDYLRAFNITYTGSAYQVAMSGAMQARYNVEVKRHSASMIENGWAAGTLWDVIDHNQLGSSYTQTNHVGPPEARLASPVYWALKIEGDADTEFVETYFDPQYGQP